MVCDSTFALRLLTREPLGPCLGISRAAWAAGLLPSLACVPWHFHGKLTSLAIWLGVKIMDSNKLRLFIGLIQSSLEVSEVSELERPALRSLLTLRLLPPPVVFLWSKFAYKITYFKSGRPVGRWPGIPTWPGCPYSGRKVIS